MFNKASINFLVGFFLIKIEWLPNKITFFNNCPVLMNLVHPAVVLLILILLIVYILFLIV
jgi:hypothetical protein